MATTLPGMWPQMAVGPVEVFLKAPPALAAKVLRGGAASHRARSLIRRAGVATEQVLAGLAGKTLVTAPRWAVLRRAATRMEPVALWPTTRPAPTTAMARVAPGPRAAGPPA